MTLAVDNTHIIMNKKAADNTVIDFKYMATAGSELSFVAGVNGAGETKTIAFGIDGLKGDLLQVYGHTTINLADFITVEGGFGFEKSSRTVKVYNSTSKTWADVATNVLVFGMSDVNAFAGYAGDAGESDDIGLKFTNVDFALATFNETTGSKRKWSTIDSTIGGAAFVGIPDVTLAVDNTHIIMNKKSAADNTVIDFKKMKDSDDAFIATTGVNALGETQTVTFATDGLKGDLLQVYGHTTINLADFITVEGGFGFEKSSRTVKVYNSTSKTWADVATNVLVFGMSDVNAFAGYAGDAGESDDIGLKFTNVDFALATFNETTGSKRKWSTIDSTIGGAAFVGIPDVTLAVDNTHIIMNKKSAADNTVIDFKKMKDSGDAFIATTGVNALGETQTVTFATDGLKGDLLQVYGHTTINLADFITVEGGFGFEKSSRTVKVYNSTSKTWADVATNVLVFGMSDVNAFAGYAGDAGESDDIGLKFTNVDFALATFNETTGSKRKWSTIDSTIGGAAFVGIPDVTLAVDNTHIIMNKKSAADNTVIDFKKMKDSDDAFIATTGVNALGETQTVTFATDGLKGDLLQVYGHAEVDLFGLVTVRGGFAFERSSRAVALSNNSTVNTSALAFGMTDVDALIGYAGDNPDGSEDFGLRLTDIELALVTFTELGGAGRRWTAVDTTVGSAEVLGIPGIELAVNQADILVSKAASDGTVVDFKKMKDAGNAVDVITGVDALGATKHVVFDLAGSRGELLKVEADVTIHLGDFVMLDGIIGFEKSTSDVYVTKGVTSTKKNLNVLSLYGANINAFVGVNGGTAEETGLKLTDVDFTLALLNDKTGSQSWFAVNAHAGSVGIVGLGDSFAISANEVNVLMNRASTDGSVIDFAKTSTVLGTTFGSTSGVILDMKGSDGDFLKASAVFDLKVSSFFQLSGLFSLEMSTQRVALATGGTITTDMFAFGGGGLDAFVGVNGVGLELDNVSFQLALFKEKNADGTPKPGARSWTALKARADHAALTGMGDIIEISGDNLDVAINIKAADNSVIDFQKTATNLHETIGSAQTQILDMTTAGVEASGHVSLKAFSFIKAEATLVFERGQQTVTLTTDADNDGAADQVLVDTLTIGAVDINAFVGSIPDDPANYANRVGFEVVNLDLAMMVMTEHLDDADIASGAVSRKWSALKASVDSVGFVGIDGITATGSALVEVNFEADWDSSLVDFTASPVTINPPGASGGVTFDIKKTTKNYLAISGSFDLGFFDFFSFQKDLLIELTFENVTLNDANHTQVMTQMLTFGKKDINAFAGINEGTEDAMGFTIENAAVGFGIFLDMTNPSRFWVAGKAEADLIGFVGPDIFNITATDLVVAINTAANDGTSIDFSQKNGGLGLAIEEGIGGIVTVGGGGTAVYLDMKGETIKAGGSLDVSLFSFLSLNGDFAFEKSSRQVKLSDGSTTTVDMMAFGGSNINAFAGYQGDKNSTSDDIGFTINDMDFAFVFLNDKGDTKRRWTTIKANIGYIGFVGLPGIKIGGSDIEFIINSASYDDLAIDFKTAPLTIGDAGITLDLDPKLGSLISFSGVFKFSMFDFVEIEEDFTIKQQLKNVILDDGSSASVAMMTIAYTNLDVYAGLNQYTDADGDLKDDNGDFLGLRIEDINFGAVLAYGVTTGDAYFSFQGEASNIGLVGVDWLDISAQKVQVAFNMSTNQAGRVIDYKAKNLSIPTGLDIGLGGPIGGTGDVFVMNLDGKLGQMIEVDVTGALLRIESFVYLSGNFAFKKAGPISAKITSGLPINPYTSDPTKILDQYSTVKLDYLTVAASDVNIFVGMNGPYFGLGDPGDAIGIYAGNVDVAFAMFNVSASETDLVIKNAGLKFMTVKAHIAEVGLVGMGDVLKVSFKDISLQVNMGSDSSGALTPWIDFKESFGAQGLAVPTGAEPVYLDFNNYIIAAGIGLAEIQVSQFLHLRGSLAFTMGQQFVAQVDMGGLKTIMSDMLATFKEVGLDLSLVFPNMTPENPLLPVNVKSITLGGANLTGFVGIGGPYRYGDDLLNADGLSIPDGLPDNINEGAVGLVIDDVDFGIAVMVPTLFALIPGAEGFTPKFITAKAHVGYAGLVGIDRDILSIKAEDVDVNINTFYWPMPHSPEPNTETALRTLELALNVTLQLFGPPSINYQATFPNSPEDKNENGILDLYDEDLNKNGNFDAGEDLNNNGTFELTEDLNRDGLLAANGFALWAGGNNAVIIDFKEEIIQAKIGYVEANLAGFLQLSASMAITKKGSESVTLSNGETTTITSVSIGINDANGFIGMPSDIDNDGVMEGYFYDSDGNGRINESDATNPDAIGLVVKNLDLGVIVAKELVIGLGGIKVGVYLACQANIDLIGLVGLEDVPVILNARDLKLDLNTGARIALTTGFTRDPETNAVSYDLDGLGLTPSLTTIDFSKSTWVDPKVLSDPNDDVVNQGYAIETGNPSEPIVLMYKNQYIRIAGQAEVNLVNVVHLTGAFEFKASPKGLTVFVDADAKIGDPDSLYFTAHAMGLLILGEEEGTVGLAAKLELGTTLNIPNILTSDIKLNFALNAFGKDVVYEVPEAFWKENGGVLDYHSITISATPPNKAAPADFYVSLTGEGQIELLSVLKLQGRFGVLFSVTDGDQVLAELSVGATIVSDVVKLGAVGTLGFSNNGLYGSLNVTGLGPNEEIIGSPGIFSIGGSFLLQINTTDKDQSVLELEKIDGVFTGNMIIPPADKPNLPKQSFHLAGKATVSIAEVIELKGSVDILINKDGFQAALDVSLDLGFIGKVGVKGAAAILDTDEGPVFALKASLNVDLGIDIINLRAGATLEINTSNTHDYVEVPKGTTFKLALHGANDPDGYGTVTVLALKGTFKGEISVVDGLFKLDLEAELKIGSLLKLDMGLKVHSDGYFYLHAGVDLDIDLAIIRLQVGASLTISSDPLFEFSVYGSLSVHIDLGFFEINETLAGFSGLIRITAASAQLSASVTLMGMTVSGDMVWSWGDPPVIATQVGDTLYLNMGDRAQGDNNYRDTDVNYQAIKNETYNISEKDGVTTVRALGVESTYNGVKKIVASGGAGNDCIITDPGVTSQLLFDGGSGNDVFMIAGGASNSVISGDDDDDLLTGGGAAGIHYYGGAGDDKFVGGDTAEIIDMGEDNNTVTGAGGDDIIYVGTGKNKVNGGSGNDTIYARTTGTLDLIGGEGDDKVILDPILSTKALKMNEHQFIYDKRTINFDNTLEGLFVTDTAAHTVIATDLPNGGALTGGGNWGSTDLTVVSSGVVDVSAASFQLSDAHLTLVSNGLTGVITGDMAELTVINSGAGDITVREANDLTIVDDSRTNGGLYAAQGNIDVQLAEREALLDLASGIIKSGKSGGNISITADDVDFASGRDKVSASGEFVLKTNDINQNYKIGAAGGSKYGQDISKGKDTGFMNFSMRDLDALMDGFSHIRIGHENAADNVIMYVGDIENRQMGSEFPVFNAKLTDLATITADTVYIVGDVQSSDDIIFNGRLAEVSKANFHDQLGPADSGVTGRTVTFNLTEQMVVTGWIIGEDRIDLNVHGSTGLNVIVGYGAEPNGITADMGSAIYTTANNSVVSLDTSHSIIIATGLEAKGTGSSVLVNAGTGLTVLEGAVVAVRESNSKIDMTAGTYAHINSGGAVTAGAMFEWVGTTPVAVKTGENAGIWITSAGEMRLSGAITSSGAMELQGGGSQNGYAEYFDTINGQTITKVTTSMPDVIADLNSGRVSQVIITALTNENYSLGSASVSSVSNYTPFASLTDEQKLVVAQSLGYQMLTIDDNTPAYYYNPVTKDLLVTFTEGGFTGSLAGYTYYAGTVYYNPETHSIKTGFIEGTPVDYDNNLIQWGSAGVPAAGATFEQLTDAQKEVVATSLGYTKDTPSPEFTRNDFVDESLKNFCNALIDALGVTFSVNTSTAIKQTDPAYVSLTDAQFGTLVKELNALLTDTGLYGKLIAKMPGQVVSAELTALKQLYDASGSESDLKNFNRAALGEFLPKYTPKMPVNTGTYFNYNAELGKKSVTTFVQGSWTDYQSEDIYWGEPAKTGDMTILAHALGYDVYTNGAWINPNATDGNQVVTVVAASGTSPDYRLEDIDWGGVAAPDDTATFEELTLAQRNVVLTAKGYTEFQGAVYYNSDTKTLLPTVAYAIDDVDWVAEKVVQPAEGTPFDKLSPLQQKLILEATNTRLYTGPVYFNPSEAPDKQYVITLVEGTDYQNSTVRWSTVEVPKSGTLFADMTAAQQNALINSLGYDKYTQTVYYKAGAPIDKALVTGFTEGIDYTNSAMNWGTAESIDTNRWIISDGTNKYVIYAMDENNDGTVDEIQIQKSYELLGQRGFGFLLNGTITSLRDNNNMVIASEDDTIIRGNINLLGANSNLTIQSDSWTYFEGVANVTGNLTLLGGVSLDGVITANAGETSVYVHATATLNTQEAGTVITIRGGKDVDIHGRTVAGGSIGANGITWAGPDSKVIISAGQQVAIDTAIAAAREVNITTSSATGADDDGVALLLTAASGLTTAGLTTGNSGGLIKIDTVGGISAMGMILSGGSVSQTFDAQGNLQTETFSWNPEKSRIDIATDGQLWLGGMTRTINGVMVEVGGVIRASEEIRLAGGVSSDDRGIRMPGSAKVAVSNANGGIYLSSVEDAEIYGVLVAGGEIIDYRDSLGKYLGSTVETYAGDSSISIESGQQIRLGRDLYAGKLIDLRGGVDPYNAS